MSSVSDAKAAKKNFKIVLLGNSGVGKTALIERFTHNKFQGKQNSTIGIDFVGKNVNLNGQTYRLQLWDTAGQQRYRSLIPSYLKDAISAVFVFDITNNQSLNDLQSWVQLFKQNKADKSIMVACGNKIDQKDKQSYDQEKFQKLVQKYKMKSFFASALSGEGVNQMFQNIIQAVHSKQEKKKKKFDESTDYMGGPMSSQNLHSQQMKSNRSNISNSGVEDSKVQQNTKTGVKLSKDNHSTKIDSKKSIDEEGNQVRVQGANRCC